LVRFLGGQKPSRAQGLGLESVPTTASSAKPNEQSKLEKWLSDFEFTDMATAIQNIDWRNVPVVEI